MTGRARRAIGMGLMIGSLSLMIVASGAAASVEESAGERVSAGENERIAFWNGQQSEAAPEAATRSFPPEAGCLVAPQLCSFPTGEDDPSSGVPTGQVADTLTGEEGSEDGLGAGGNLLVDEMNRQYSTGIEEAQGNDPGSPAEPVPPDTLPVSVNSGQEYYRSAIQFPLPDVPEGHEVDEFILYFPQGNPTFSNESPALRQAVLAGLTCARDSDSNPSGRCEQEEFEKVVNQSCDSAAEEGQCLRSEEPLVIQACPIGLDPLTGEERTEWRTDDADGPYNEESLPTTNCIKGALAEMIEIEGTTYWAFDLTRAMSSWIDGSMEYHGLLLTPGSAANFAFGDRETTYNKQTTLMAAAEYAITTSEIPPPPVQRDFGGGTATGPAPNSGTTTPPAPPVFSQPPVPGANSPVSVPTQAQTQTTTPEPNVAPSTGGAQQTTDLAATQPAAVEGSAWYVWLLVPVFLLGAWLLTRSLEEQLVAAPARSGAMTRLLERQARQGRPDLIGG